MSNLSVAEITRILQAAGITIVSLLTVILLLRIPVHILHLVLRKKLTSGIDEMIGQQALVRKTVRTKKPGEIEIEWKGKTHTAQAVSDRTIRSGRPVLIYALEKDCFKVRPIVFDYVDGRYEIKD